MPQQLALFDPLAARYTRTCIRCGQSPLGRSYSTLYGYIEVVAPGPTRDGSPYILKVHSCGEICHHICPAPGSQPRQAYHDPATADEQTRPSRVKKHIAPGIDLQPNGRYAARHGKKRLKTWETVAEAQAAIDKYRNKQATAPSLN